jgi:predicted acylesterase/phospholipase RssA
MRRKPQQSDNPSVGFKKSTLDTSGHLGLVLSGGGSRAAYQAGALRALIPYLGEKNPFSVIIGSSIGAINGLVLGAAIKEGLPQSVEVLSDLWRERTWGNTFGGSPTASFFRAIKMATMQYFAPGPSATNLAIFDPSPLMKRIDEIIDLYGGLAPHVRDPKLQSVAVMTTVEGFARRPLLFASTHHPLPNEVLEGASFEVCYREQLHAKHGFASAALPSVLPPVEIDTDDGTLRLVDGGISINVPVDPAVRMGAEKVIVIDISGRNWWLDRSGEPHDTRPSWEVESAHSTYCMRPPQTFTIRPQVPLGPLLKQCVCRSSTRFIKSVGPIWPAFTLLKNKVGEDVAYEAMTYVALDEEYILSLMELGFKETKAFLKNKTKIDFVLNDSDATNPGGTLPGSLETARR